MKLLYKYWYLTTASALLLLFGVLTLFVVQKLQKPAPVAPTVPQAKPKAVEADCTLAFNLASPSPTATPTATVTNAPTATPTPTPTPTSAANTDPECTGLSVSPNSAASPPLSVTLTCSGKDPDGDITAAEFIFGDGQTKTVEKNVGSPGSISTNYTYTKEGSFPASCRVRDNNFKFTGTPDACKKTVTIGSAPVVQATPTPQPVVGPTPKVPVAGGGPSVLGASVIAGGILLLLLGLAL